MAYTAHLALLTIGVTTPLHPNPKRPWLITEQQAKVARLVAGTTGWRGDQREGAAKLGMSLSSFNDALQSLVTGGVIAVRTVRGRLGFTIARMRENVRLLREMFGIQERPSSKVDGSPYHVAEHLARDAYGRPFGGPSRRTFQGNGG